MNINVHSWNDLVLRLFLTLWLLAIIFARKLRLDYSNVFMISHVFPLTTKSMSNKTCLPKVVYFAFIIHRDQSF